MPRSPLLVYLSPTITSSTLDANPGNVMGDMTTYSISLFVPAILVRRSSSIAIPRLSTSYDRVIATSVVVTIILRPLTLPPEANSISSLAIYHRTER